MFRISKIQLSGGAFGSGFKPRKNSLKHPCAGRLSHAWHRGGMSCVKKSVTYVKKVLHVWKSVTCVKKVLHVWKIVLHVWKTWKNRKWENMLHIVTYMEKIVTCVKKVLHVWEKKTGVTWFNIFNWFTYVTKRCYMRRGEPGTREETKHHRGKPAP